MNRCWQAALQSLILACLSLTVAAAQPKAEIRQPERLPPEVALQRGQEIIQDLLSRQPAENSSLNGTLSIQEPGGKWRKVPVRVIVQKRTSDWVNTYEAQLPNAAGTLKLAITHLPEARNSYQITDPGKSEPRTLAGNETMIAFAGSDYWIADLGLEFYHWPQQALVKTELKRGQSCHVIESTNPKPAPGAYKRVMTWIDIDTGGIVSAEAYDANEKLLKRFAPKTFEKVEGQWRLQRMEIMNRQSGTRSIMEFENQP